MALQNYSHPLKCPTIKSMKINQNVFWKNFTVHSCNHGFSVKATQKTKNIWSQFMIVVLKDHVTSVNAVFHQLLFEMLQKMEQRELKNITSCSLEKWSLKNFERINQYDKKLVLFRNGITYSNQWHNRNYMEACCIVTDCYWNQHLIRSKTVI